ncbi:hypothetical protein FRC17_009385 [Serendipita sp. 399]|nr:hypothetical protein FRC17_009385 [Serendipita sp. 399]
MDVPLLFLFTLIVFVLWIIIKRPGQQSQPSRRSTTPVQVQPTEENESREMIEAFLVLDVEATCVPNGGFEEPNEIIEWPVILLIWDKKAQDASSKRLVVKDTFHSYCRPILRPTLHPFCTELTGITQEQVDQAPTFPEVLSLCKGFLVKNGIIDQQGKALKNYAWCTDGPWDLRDFLQKQVFISQIGRPSWLRLHRIIDVRSAFGQWYVEQYLGRYGKKPRVCCPILLLDFLEVFTLRQNHGAFSIKPSFKLNRQLELLGLKFEGREHSGLDDSRNIARILVELASRGITLEPNLDVSPTRTFPWMGPNGTVATAAAAL